MVEQKCLGLRKRPPYIVTGKGHVEEWQEENVLTHCYDGYWADQKWTEVYCSDDDLYNIDEYGYFQSKVKKGKGKERKAKKAR